MGNQTGKSEDNSELGNDQNGQMDDGQNYIKFETITSQNDKVQSRDAYLQQRSQQFSALETNLYVSCNHYKKDGEPFCAQCRNSGPLRDSKFDKELHLHSEPGKDKISHIQQSKSPGPQKSKKNLTIDTTNDAAGQSTNIGQQDETQTNQTVEIKPPVLHDFDIIRVIGKGGFSTVFQVRKKDEGSIYAMKCLKKEQIKRENKVRHVMNERQILQNIRHPFIVKMHWAFQSEHYLFIVLEFCPGGEIFYHMNKVLRFSERVAKFYFAEIVLALEYLHQNNIFYRDLKPENILLDQDGHIKLADFGISRLNFTERERTNSFCGSPEYMSPEMLRQGRVHGRNLDFYSLGALLFEMLTGLPPHFSENRDEMYRKILHSKVDYPKYLSPMAKSLLKGLLVKNPDQRLGSAYGIQEIKDHPFCMDINWDDVLNKVPMPPIKPSQKYSNFDPEYTNLPVRFTYEEDFQTPQNQRRKSDPGGMLDLYQQTMQGQSSSGLISWFQQAFMFPSQGSDKQLKEKYYQHLSSLRVTQNLDTSQYMDPSLVQVHRGVSQTFRGYSFLKNNEIGTSSQILKSQLQDSQSLNQRQVAQQQKQFQPTDNFHPENIKTHLQQLSQQFPSIYNLPDDYIFTTGGQRSRTVSFANQSMLTEGVEQKNIYAMNLQGFNQLFQDIQVKANEYEFNSYNHQFLKRWKMLNEINWDNQTQVFIKNIVKDKNSPYLKHLTGGPQNNIAGRDLSHWDYSNAQQSNARIPHMEENKITEADLEDENLYIPPTADKTNVGHKITQILIQDQSQDLDKYTKNLILYNDVINNVKSERKRLPKNQPKKQVQVRQQETSQNTINDKTVRREDPFSLTRQERRKPVQSLHTNHNPLQFGDTRKRIDSNYSVKSGGDLNAGNNMDESNEQIKQQAQNRKDVVKEKSSLETRNALKSKKQSIGKSYQTQVDKGLAQINETTTPQKTSLNIGSKLSGEKQSQIAPSTWYPSSPRSKLKQSVLQPASKKSPLQTLSKPSNSSQKDKQNVNFKSRNSAHVPITGIQLYQENKSVSAKKATTSKDKGTFDYSHQAMTIKPKATHLEQIDETEPLEKLSKEMQAMKSISGVGVQLQKLIDPTQKSTFQTKDLTSYTADKTKKRGGVLFSPPNKNDMDSLKKPFLKGFQNNLLTPKGQMQNRVKTKSLYDPSTQIQKRKEDDMKQIEDFDNLRGVAKVMSKNQRSKSSSSFDELEDNVDEFHQNENQNFQKIKNPSLMTSIVSNTNRRNDISLQANGGGSLVIPSQNHFGSILMTPQHQNSNTKSIANVNAKNQINNQIYTETQEVPLSHALSISPQRAKKNSMHYQFQPQIASEIKNQKKTTIYPLSPDPGNQRKGKSRSVWMDSSIPKQSSGIAKSLNTQQNHGESNVPSALGSRLTTQLGGNINYRIEEEDLDYTPVTVVTYDEKPNHMKSPNQQSLNSQHTNSLQHSQTLSLPNTSHIKNSTTTPAYRKTSKDEKLANSRSERKLMPTTSTSSNQISSHTNQNHGTLNSHHATFNHNSNSTQFNSQNIGSIQGTVNSSSGIHRDSHTKSHLGKK
eukprot:403377493